MDTLSVAITSPRDVKHAFSVSCACSCFPRRVWGLYEYIIRYQSEDSFSNKPPPNYIDY